MISDMYITKSDISFKESNLYDFSFGRGKYLYTICILYDTENIHEFVIIEQGFN
jgi:hypothetical protein